MCDQLSLLREVQAAAHALARVCLCQIEVVSVSLHQVYDPSLAEPLPADLALLLEQIGPDRGTA